jgi:hypothetical protein
MPFESIVAAGDAGEGLDETRDGPEEPRERREVAEHRKVTRALLDLRELAEPRLVHRGEDLLVRAVRPHEARLHDAGERRRVPGADLDGPLDVARRDLRSEQPEELLLVDHGFPQIDGALDDDRDRQHQQEEDGPHPPSAFMEGIGQ